MSCRDGERVTKRRRWRCKRDAKRGRERERGRKRRGGGSSGLYECGYIVALDAAFIDAARCTWASSGANHLGRIIGSELL